MKLLDLICPITHTLFALSWTNITVYSFLYIFLFCVLFWFSCPVTHNSSAPCFLSKYLVSQWIFSYDEIATRAPTSVSCWLCEGFLCKWLKSNCDRSYESEPVNTRLWYMDSGEHEKKKNKSLKTPMCLFDLSSCLLCVNFRFMLPLIS